LDRALAAPAREADEALRGKALALRRSLKL
jgi:hypothetical protein